MTPLHLPILLSLFTSPVAPGRVAAPADPADTLAERTEVMVRPLVDAGHLSGSVLVVRGGEVLLRTSWGFANRELGVPNGPRSRFCIGAISAHMTRALVSRLIETGAIDPETTIDTWVDDFPEGDKITIARLRDYEAGIPQHIFEADERTRPQTTRDAVEAAKRHELMFEPGSSRFFGFGSYCILAYALEQATGRTYGQLIQEMVFEPAGMTSSGHIEGGKLLPGKTSAYRIGHREILNARHEDVSYLTGSSSIWSTPDDLYSFFSAVRNGTLGKAVLEELDLTTEFHWIGIFTSYRAFVDYYPEQDLFVAFTSNARTGAIDVLRGAMPQLVAGAALPPAAPPQAKEYTPDPGSLAELVGAYEIPGNELEMTLVGKDLFLGEWALIPVSEDRFYSPMDYAQVSVMRDKDGAVEGLTWAIGGRGLPCRKLR